MPFDSYDLAGRRTGLGGSYARTALPLAIGNASYSADNQLTAWGTAGRYGVYPEPSRGDANGNSGFGSPVDSTGVRTPGMISDAPFAPRTNLRDGFNSFNWNARNQIASMNYGANSFTYDAYGRRASKTISSTTTNYLYEGVNVVQELSGSTPTANLLAGSVLGNSGSGGVPGKTAGRKK